MGAKIIDRHHPESSWWRHQMETFSALLAICAGNSPIPGEFTTQRPVTRSFDVFFDLCLNKRLSKQSWGWWFETIPWASYQIPKIAGCACAGNARDVFPVNRGLAIPTCITAWCMPGSLTRGFLWSGWRVKRSRYSRHSRRMCNPQFYVSGKRPMQHSACRCIIYRRIKRWWWHPYYLSVKSEIYICNVWKIQVLWMFVACET